MWTKLKGNKARFLAARPTCIIQGWTSIDWVATLRDERPRRFRLDTSFAKQNEGERAKEDDVRIYSFNIYNYFSVEKNENLINHLGTKLTSLFISFDYDWTKLNERRINIALCFEIHHCRYAQKQIVSRIKLLFMKAKLLFKTFF